MPLTYQKIATVTVGAGGASNITFSSIPQTYTDIKVVVSARTDRSGFTYDNIRTYPTTLGHIQMGVLQIYQINTCLDMEAE